jgi:hypothetical protein
VADFLLSLDGATWRAFAQARGVDNFSHGAFFARDFSLESMSHTRISGKFCGEASPTSQKRDAGHPATGELIWEGICIMSPDFPPIAEGGICIMSPDCSPIARLLDRSRAESITLVTNLGC